MRHTVRLALVLTAAASLAACGGNKAANTSANTSTTNSAGTMAPGNDASAMETMAPAPATNAPAATVTTTTTTTSNSSSTTTPPPAVDTKTAPGGDMGGNSSDKNIPGM